MAANITANPSNSTVDQSVENTDTVLKTTLIITVCVCVFLLVFLFFILRFCCGCCKRKPSPTKTYETAGPDVEDHGYAEIAYTGKESEAEKVDEEKEWQLSSSFPCLDLDLGTNSYLTARPPSYLDLDPLPSTDTKTLDRKVEISGVDPIHKGVSVKIKDGRWHRIIDIQFQ